jgi:hypothetical protein
LLAAAAKNQMASGLALNFERKFLPASVFCSRSSVFFVREGRNIKRHCRENPDAEQKKPFIQQQNDLKTESP